MATKITTRVLADNAVTDAKIADVTLTTATQSASDNTTKVATTAYVTTAIANLADSAPSTLNTLNELAAALGDDASFSTTVTNSIATKSPLANPTFTTAINGGDGVTLQLGDSQDIVFKHHASGYGHLENKTGTLYMDSETFTIRTDIDDLGTALFIDASQNVMVGGTNSRPAEFTHPKGISFRGDIGQIQASTDGNLAMLLNRDTSDGTIVEFRKEGSAVGSIGTNTSGGSSVLDFSAAAIMRMVVGGSTEAMRLLANGNVGIGYSAPTEKLFVKHGSVNQTIARFTGANNDRGLVIGTAISGSTNDSVITYDAVSTNSVGQHVFKTDGTERMRISSAGTILVGKTAEGTATDGIELNRNDVIVATRDGDAPLILNRRSSDGDIINFRKDNSAVGNIGTVDADLLIHSTVSGHIGLRFGNGYLGATDNAGAVTNGVADLGLSTVRWKDLYLSGVARLGTSNTYATIEGKANSDLEIIANAGQINGNPNIIFKSSNAGSSVVERARIASDGTTTIGRAITTTYDNDQGYPLHIQAAGGSQTYLSISLPGDASGNTGLVIGHDNTGTRILNREAEPIVFHANAGSETMRMLSGGGLTFNGDTAAANALDDYEEGSWTPTASTSNGNGSFSVTVNYAKYIKVGGLVHASCYLSIVVSNVGSGAAIIGGLPFVNTSGQGYSIASVGHASAIEYHTNDGVAAYVTNGHNYIRHVNVTDTVNVGWSGTGTKYYMMSCTYHSV